MGPFEEVFGTKLIHGQTSGLHFDLDRSENIEYSMFDPAGKMVAVVVKDTLFILFDLPGGDNAGMLMRRILKQYTLEYLFLGVEDKEYARFKQAYLSSLRKNLAKANREKKDFERSLKSAKREVREYKRLCIKKWQEIEFTSDSLIKAGSGDTIKETLDQLRSIALANGSKLEIWKDQIKLGLGQIDLEHNGRVYDIGEFDLEIKLSEGGESVKCFNRTRRVSERNYNHPHVDRHGIPCFGNIDSEMKRLIVSRQLVPLVYAMMVYLRSLNPNDRGWQDSQPYWPTKER